MKKIIRNSFISIIVGVLISIAAEYFMQIRELINYIGAMFVLGGCIFLDQWMVAKVFDHERADKRVLLRLPVYILFSVVLLMLPTLVTMHVYVVRILRSFGISFLLLALWRFFTYTTKE